MESIDFDVKLTTNELYAFLMQHTYRNIGGILGLIISIGSLILCACRYKYFDRTTIMALIIIGMLFTVVQPIMLYSKARTQVKRNESINEKLHYSVSEDGITVSQGEQEGKVKWYEVRKKIISKNAMYIYMSPVRAFIFTRGQCEEQYDRLVDMVNDMVEKYKNYEPEETEEVEESDEN